MNEVFAVCLECDELYFKLQACILLQKEIIYTVILGGETTDS